MNYHFLIIFGLLTVLNRINAKGHSSAPRPFWQQQIGSSQSVKSYQQSPSSQQDEASAEPTPQIPQTSFSCIGKPYIIGMYADVETNCEVYHVCLEDQDGQVGRKESFFCGAGTVFNQKILTCDYPKDTDCAGSQRYWSANEELGKPGAEPGIPNRIPISPSKTNRQYYQQNRQQSTYQGPIPQQPVKQRPAYNQQIPQQPVYQQQPAKQKPVYQPIPQQPVQQPPVKQYEDNGFVDEPVKKIRPTYKVVKTPQQPVSYQPNVSYPPKVYLSPAKSKLQQEALPLDELGRSVNYQQQESYQQSDSYFSQEQTSGNWKPIQQQQLVRQQVQHPVRQYQQSIRHTSSSQQNYYNQQPSIRKTSSNQQQHYNQQSNSQTSWKAIKPGGYSYNEITEQKIDISIPKTNFRCDRMPYEPGMYADTEASCSIYHVCFEGRQETFACGKGTVFSQQLLTCDYPEKVDCQNTPRYYSSNENLVREQGNWVLRQSNQQQNYSNRNQQNYSNQKQHNYQQQSNQNDGWSNQRKIK